MPLQNHQIDIINLMFLFIFQTGINITFTGNIAWFGAGVYATSLTSCSCVSDKVRQSFDESSFPQWPIVHVR